MKALVVCESFFKDPSWRIMQEQAELYLEKGYDVTIVACAGCSRTCFLNIRGNGIMCRICHRLQEKYLNLRFKGKAHIVFLRRGGNAPVPSFAYNTMKDVKSFRYRDVNVGYAVLSSYITLTRELIKDMTPAHRSYLDFMLGESCRLVDAATGVIDEVNPDVVAVYNGRLLEERPFLDIAHNRGIHVDVMEVMPTRDAKGDFEFYRIVYDNTLPHDIDTNEKIIEDLWKLDNENVDKKIRGGSDFFEKRRHGKAAGDHPFAPGKAVVFTEKQKAGLLPKDFDVNKRNIVIFNSSEDEYSSIDPKFDSFSLFGSQYEGVDKIASSLERNPNYHLYLRIHPNLTKIHYAYHTDLLKLAAQHANLTVIAAESPCSTYDLMEAADKVVVFGSTMGAEAAYWGKPVILLAAALYANLGFCYRPRNIDELDKFLFDKELLSKDRLGAIKYGYFMTHRSLCAEICSHINLKCRNLKIFSKKISCCEYPVLLGGLRFTRFVRSRLWRFIPFGNMANLPSALFEE